MRPNVLLLEAIHPEARAELERLANVYHEEDPKAVRALLQRQSMDAIITRGKGHLRRALIKHAASLQVIARVGVGLDNIDVNMASEQGILVLNAPGSTTEAVAEHTMLLMLNLVRRAYPLAQAARQGDWAYRRQYLGDTLADKTLGLIGMGAIAQRVAKMATAFGMHICYWNRTSKTLPYEACTLEALLARADVISIHVALTVETRHLLNRAALSKLKQGVYLINTARGAVVDQQAVYDLLVSGHLAGFASDVLDPEPPVATDPLLTHPNAFITPHTAALTEATFRKMSLRTVRNVSAVLRGDAPEPASVYNQAALRAQR